VVEPHWNHGRTVLLDTAAFAVSVIAGKGTTSATAGAAVFAAALVDRPDRIEGAFAIYEARL
jgi:2-polyprenyl-6-methoxyphenol hydroxylase-like FAD-dependent oxidoreductase